MSNIAGKLEAAERARAECEREVAELKRQLAEKSKVSSVSNNPELAKFQKMVSMGIPIEAVKQKMEQAGLNPSDLNGGPMLGQPSGPSRPAGNPMTGLFSGILGGPGGLKKTNGPQKAVVMNAPKDPKKEAAMGIAEAAAAKRAEMAAKGNIARINEKLAMQKKPQTSFLSGELFKRFGRKHPARDNDSDNDTDPGSPKEPSSQSSPVAGTVVGNLQYSNTNENGTALPPGIRRVSDAQDTWYEEKATGVVNWSVESLLKKKNSVKSRKGGRRANRKSRKNRKSRRSN